MAILTHRAAQAPKTPVHPGGPGVFTPVWVTALFHFSDQVLTGSPFTRAGETWLCVAQRKFSALARETHPFVRLATDEEIVASGGPRGSLVTPAESVPETPAEPFTAQAAELPTDQTTKTARKGRRKG